MIPKHGLLASTPLLLLLSVSCGTPEEVQEDSEPPEAEVRALTREQIQEHAEAMSPEVAESLGIVDTTIRIESPMPAESVRPPEFLSDSVPSQ